MPQNPEDSSTSSVWIVSGIHFAVPGKPTEVFSSLMLAQNYALSLTNMLLEYVELPPETDASMWENAMEEARKKRADDLGIDYDDLDFEPEDDGWVEIVEKVLDPAIA